jgi:hypothetical protein
LFLPLVGSVIYIITQVYNKRDVEVIGKEITSIINPTKKIRDLENALEFSETFKNRSNLADAYFELKDFSNAIKHYELVLKGHHAKDFFIIQNLIRAYFEIEDYKKVLYYAEIIESHPNFHKSTAKFIYGLALEKLGRIDEAEMHIKTIDQRYSNYEERLILAKFYMAYDKMEEAKELLNEIHSESLYMTKENQRIYKVTIAEVQNLLKAF